MVYYYGPPLGWHPSISEKHLLGTLKIHVERNSGIAEERIGEFAGKSKQREAKRGEDIFWGEVQATED